MARSAGFKRGQMVSGQGRNKEPLARPMPAEAPERLGDVLAELRACTACAAAFQATASGHAPRPVAQIGEPPPRIALVGQAPGIRVHRSGLPFDDPSGDRLRSWLGVDRETFYDPARFAILPMGFCFPGHDSKGGDLPPPRQCATLWRDRLFACLPRFALMVLIGRAAIAWHAPALSRRPLPEIVGRAPAGAFAPETAEEMIVAPHPSWRNNAWLKRNPRFEAEIVPHLRTRVAAILESA